MEKPSSFVPRLLTFLGFLAGAAIVVFAAREYRFYLLPVAERPSHAHFALLRSSGLIGHGMGLVGTALVFLNLGYLIRRQFLDWEWLGSLRTWMTLHICTGVVGGGLVLLHSTFVVRSLMGGMAFWAMAVVLVTGLLGRYIYAHVPRSLEGRELELNEIRDRLGAYRTQLKALGLHHEIFQQSLTETGDAGDAGILGTVKILLWGDAATRRELRQLQEAVAASDALRGQSREILSLARRFLRERQWFARYAEIRSFMGGWRFFHRWFAVIMLSAVLYHVLLALQMGRRWIF